MCLEGGLKPIIYGNLDQLPLLHLSLITLVYRIDMQCEINVQVGKFLKNIKCAGQNRRAGGKIFLKNIKRAGQNRPE